MIAKVTIKMWKLENSLAKTFHVSNINECMVAKNIDTPLPKTYKGLMNIPRGRETLKSKIEISPTEGGTFKSKNPLLKE